MFIVFLLFYCFIIICTCNYIYFQIKIPIPILPVGKPGILTCKDSGGDFHWKTHDLSISIPPNSFTDAIPAKLNITAYLAVGNQSFYGCHIVSAVFKIESSIKKFSSPVKLQIPHCVILESSDDCEKMHFYVQHEDEYAIKRDGVFNVGEFYGTVELTEFSCVLIIWENAVNYCRMIITFVITHTHEANAPHQEQHEQQLQQQQQSGDSSSSESESSSANDHQSYDSKSKGSGDQLLTKLAYGEILTLPLDKQSDRWTGAYCIVKNLETWLQVFQYYSYVCSIDLTYMW